MGGTNVEQLMVECACGKRLKAPASAVGKRAKCPGCGAILTIEAPPPPPVEEETDFNALYELAAQESEAASRQDNSSSSSMRCPSCSAQMTPGAVVCVQCGFDMRTKSKVRPKSRDDSSPAPATKQGKSKSSPRAAAKESESGSEGISGNYFLGLLFGLLAGTAAASVCFFVWYKAAGVPFTGWMVLLIGAATGYGVNAGYKAGTHFAGATAAALTFVIVLVTKFGVLAAFVAPAVGQAIAEVKLNRDHRVLEMLVEEEMKAQNVKEDRATYAQIARIRKAATEKLNKLPEDDYQALVRKADEIEDKEELVSTLIRNELNSHPETARGTSQFQYEFARDAAQKRVDAMTPAQRRATLAELRKQTEAEFAAYRAKVQEARAAAEASAAKEKEKETVDSDDGGGGGSLVGFAIIIVIILFLWTMLPSVIAMSLAWKIAANS